MSSAAAALHFVKHIKPSLLLLAYHLPDMDGLALYDLLQETKGLGSIPAIIFGVPLPAQALAIITTQRLVFLDEATLAMMRQRWPSCDLRSE